LKLRASLPHAFAIAGSALIAACSVYLDESLLDKNADPAAATTDDGGAPPVTTTPAPTGDQPAPSLTAVAPGSLASGSKETQITASGIGFVASSKVTFAGAALATTFVDATTLLAVIPAAKLAEPGSFPITVVTPAPGGGTSSSIAFTVTSASSSTVTSLTPSTALSGSADTSIAVAGTGFVSGAVVKFNGASIATTFTSATALTATIPASALAAGGTFPVSVSNPTGGPAAPLDFTVTNPVPTVTTVSPPALTALAGNTTITVNGTGFRATGSVVKANTTTLVTTFVSDTQLTAVVPAAQLATPTSLAITVVNAAPGGGTSAAANVRVTCDIKGVDVALTSTGQSVQKSANLNVQLPSFKDGSTCPATILTSPTEGSRGWVVQNQTTAPAILSAWAVCSAQSNDAFLTFYRRATAPASGADLVACTPNVSEGKNGPGGLSSPESNGSSWCPGLTKANGGGVPIAACEKMVVFAQEYDVGTGPGSFKIALDAP
jgi:hypothetical protein